MEISMMAIGDSHRTLVLLGFVVYTHNCRKCYILVGGQWKWKILLFPVCVHWSLNATHSPSGVCTPMWRSHIRFKTTTDSGGLWATQESCGLGAALTPLFSANEMTRRDCEGLWVWDELFLESHDLYLPPSSSCLWSDPGNYGRSMSREF